LIRRPCRLAVFARAVYGSPFSSNRNSLAQTDAPILFVKIRLPKE
jgi:hypothetical protein